MSRRTRSFSGILALFTLAHAPGQWVTASLCAPARAEAAAATSRGAMAAPAPGHAGHDAAAHSGNGSRQAIPESAGCPLGPLGMAPGCVGAASIPSFVAFSIALPAGRGDVLPHSIVAPRPLFGADIFRPPRA